MREPSYLRQIEDDQQIIQAYRQLPNEDDYYPRERYEAEVMKAIDGQGRGWVSAGGRALCLQLHLKSDIVISRIIQE